MQQISVAFDRNVAASSGGAVKVMVYDPTNINFADCSFSENTAVIGGAMELASNTTTAMVPTMRLREVEIHHADLDAGYTRSDWSTAFSAASASATSWICFRS